jgi:hypothetical protein
MNRYLHKIFSFLLVVSLTAGAPLLAADMAITGGTILTITNGTGVTPKIQVKNF